MRFQLGVRRTFGIGLAIAALSVVASVSAASASAASPEFIGGTPSFTVSSTEYMSLRSPAGTWNCEHISGSGAITGKKTGNITLSLSCANTYGLCHAVGINGINTTELEMIPVYPVKSESIAVEMRPKVGTTFAKGETPFGGSCEIKGSLLAYIKPRGEINETREFTLEFKGQSGGVQVPSQYETESHEVVNSWLEYNTSKSGSFQKLSWSGTALMKLSQPIRIR
jgi:hypothetical protein